MRVERAAFNPDSSLGRSRESMATSTSGVFEEEKVGVIRSGMMHGGFTPFKIKGKGRSYYVVLSERALEMYDSQKSYVKKDKKKPVIFTIDLAVAFNVHNEHYDPKLGKCVCVMRPDDTLLLRAENDQANTEWFDAILNTTCSARALRLGRHVQPTEFFECAYDVQIVETPRAKVAHKKGEESPPSNLIDKYPHVVGPRRLCFYAHTIFLCEMGVEPGKEDKIPSNCIPPFEPKQFFEIQRKFIPNFGYRDSYFILMMGRGSPMGSCEMWAECENKQVAEHLHHALNAIIDREAEKKKRMGNGVPLAPPTLPAVSSARGHRERSHTQPHRQRLPSEIMARNTNSPLAHLARKSSTGTIASVTSSYRTPSSLGDPSTSSSSSSSLPVPGTRHSFAAPSAVKSLVVGDHMSCFPPAKPRRPSETIKEEPATNYQEMDPTDEAKRRWEELMRGEMMGGRRAISPSTTRSSTDETEDSGGTLKCFDDTEDSGGTLKMGVESKPHTPNGSIRNMSMMQQCPRQFVPISSKADHLSSSEDDADVISAGTNTSTGGESVSGQEGDVDYTHMDVVNWADGEGLNVPLGVYKLDTPRSFVSSSDSCYSSMAERQQLMPREQPVQQQDAPPTQFRTYSFGPGHPHYQRPGEAKSSPQEIDPGVTSSNDGVEAGGDATNTKVEATAASKEDARKRAFSLGSKNFFAYCSRPFRKISGHSARARHSATSTSGASLASSTVSSGPPPSSVSSNHIASLGHPSGMGLMGAADKDDPRNRSGSFGSGRSTPYSRRSGPIDKSRDHLMELDFGNPSGHHGLGRCGSGSMGSVESPSRSRTSSFGGNLKKDERADNDTDGLTPSQILLQKAKQLSIDDMPAAHDDSDYVETEPPSIPLTMMMTSPRLTTSSSNGSSSHHHHHHHHGHRHAHHPVQQLQHAQHHSPDHGPSSSGLQQQLGAGGGGYPGGVLDVMGKAHDSRSSQYFETIEETTSGRSSRASSIDDDCEAPSTRDDDDSEYTLMECGVPPAAAAAAGDHAASDADVQHQLQPVVALAATAPQQLQPQSADGRQGNRSRSSSPCTRRVDSSSTLQSVSSTSDRSDRENSSKEGGGKQLQQMQQQPNRQKISTQSEGPAASLLTAPLGLPKRSSVPVLKDAAGDSCSSSRDDPAAAAAALNYAYLQLNNDAASAHAAAMASSAATAAAAADARSRSKSGIIFAGNKETPSTAELQQQQPQHIEYAVFKPLQ